MPDFRSAVPLRSATQTAPRCRLKSSPKTPKRRLNPMCRRRLIIPYTDKTYPFYPIYPRSHPPYTGNTLTGSLKRRPHRPPRFQTASPNPNP
ncbi:hypothetical protein [Kingella potus]|uniref:hypothetical protein n=1 Tax=Kingella potus TaxID=265175 RepID=UPI001FD3FAFB|nr:hypothetical protein [Kingella potus]UOP00336.1 hypothetical protein LVJ84_10590 [Kingella potus]